MDLQQLRRGGGSRGMKADKSFRRSFFEERGLDRLESISVKVRVSPVDRTPITVFFVAFGVRILMRILDR